MQVWLRYDEVRTQSPPAGFEGCDDTDRRSRIEETFAVEIGPKPAPADRHAKITVGGTATDPDQALRVFDPAAPLVFDESVPHQALPGPELPPRWLIQIGFVRWQPAQNAAGHFAPRVDTGPDKDSDKIRRVRRYVGLVAEALQAADGAIRLRDRAKDPSTSAFSAPTTDLVWVEGHLRVEGDARVCGGDLDFAPRTARTSMRRCESGDGKARTSPHTRSRSWSGRTPSRRTASRSGRSRPTARSTSSSSWSARATSASELRHRRTSCTSTARPGSARTGST